MGNQFTNCNHKDFLKNPNSSSIYLNDTTPTEILNLIYELDGNKNGPSSIPTNILKLIAPMSSVILSKIINNTYETGIYPECLKSSNVTPVFKKDSKLVVTNYRPISLLSNINKIFEKTLYTRLYSFFELSKVINQNQFGFRKNHSTVHALMKLTDQIYKALDNHQYACGVFLDLQKAFDTVEHSILLEKLSHYGIRGVVNNLINSYLTDHSQSVSIKGARSRIKKVIHGVPQGSVLGPLLFLIYINDMQHAIRHSTMFHFADDTSILHCNKSLKRINQEINHDLKLINIWLRTNKICLNTTKTEIILFRSKFWDEPTKQTDKNKPKELQRPKHLNFRISGQRIHPVTSVKYLGVILDQHLSWEKHVNQLLPKLSRANGLLAKVRHSVNTETLLNVYYGLFHSHLTYASMIWGQNPTESINKLCILQNKALRIISFKGPRETADPLYNSLKILKFEDVMNLQNCMFTTKLLIGKLPKALNNLFKFVNHQAYDTRALFKLEVQRPIGATYGTNSITNRIIKCWNEVIPNINLPRENCSVIQVKKSVRKYLETKYDILLNTS